MEPGRGATPVKLRRTKASMRNARRSPKTWPGWGIPKANRQVETDHAADGNGGERGQSSPHREAALEEVRVHGGGREDRLGGDRIGKRVDSGECHLGVQLAGDGNDPDDGLEHLGGHLRLAQGREERGRGGDGLHDRPGQDERDGVADEAHATPLEPKDAHVPAEERALVAELDPNRALVRPLRSFERTKSPGQPARPAVPPHRPAGGEASEEAEPGPLRSQESERPRRAHEHDCTDEPEGTPPRERPQSREPPGPKGDGSHEEG